MSRAPGPNDDDAQHPKDLLASIPFGKLLTQVLRLLISADRRDEFVGDLVEQVNNERAGSTPLQIGLWLWGQTLHSAPSLLALRARRLARRGPAAGHGHQFPGVLVGNSRVAARSWPVPMAVSVTVHAIALFSFSLVAWTIEHIEQIEPPWVPVVLSRALAPLAPTSFEAASPPQQHEQEQDQPQAEPKQHRKPRPAERRIERTPAVPPEAPSPLPSVPAEAIGLDEGPRGSDDDGAIVITLPPLVAEKRCLSCPAPRLPPAFVRLGAEQQIVVKTCVDSSGDVTSVNVLRGLGTMADAGIIDTVRGWRFSPHSVGDHPVPFCYPTRFIFAMN